MEKSIQDEFISTVSHELRTPLTSIRGFSQTLLNSWDRISDDDKKKFLKIIEEQSIRLINLVENILSVSKFNSQVCTKVDVNAEIRKVLQLLSLHYKNHNFVDNLAKQSLYALLDSDKFQQIMTNLLDNAAKYSEAGKNVYVLSELKNDKVVIKVKDEGVGIKEEDCNKVFDKFIRLENHLTSKTQGNGLGLYITKQLVEKMGGSISLESVIGKGTTFILTFPLYNQEEALKCSQMS